MTSGKRWRSPRNATSPIPRRPGSDLYRRSLYTFWRRTVGPANMFDASNRQTCRVRLATTSTPLHALTTLNDPTWVEAARVLAERSMKADDDARRAADARLPPRALPAADASATSAILRRALREAAGDLRRPIRRRRRRCLTVGAAPRDESLDPAEHAALTAVCLAILNLDEALTRE